MLRRILLAALIAGAAAGLVATGLQMARLVPLIRAAEVYEAAGATDEHSGVAHEEDAEPAGGRLAYTLLFNLLAGVGFALLVNAGLALRGAAGHPADLPTGIAWGLAGFASFALAPALGLPPELPGMPSADLIERQTWWIATALATACGIGLLATARGGAWRALKVGGGLALLALPHIVGAPDPAEGMHSAVPAEMAARFAVAALASAAVFWLVLGSLSGWLQQRLN